MSDWHGHDCWSPATNIKWNWSGGVGRGGWLERLGVTFDIDEELISCQCTRAATSLSRILDAGNEGKLTAEGVRGTPPQPPPTLRCLSAAPAATLT